MKDSYTWQRTMVVHPAGSIGEAMVIRSLLEGSVIRSPVAASTKFFAENEPPGGYGVEPYAFESQADEACKLIEEYLGGASESESES